MSDELPETPPVVFLRPKYPKSRTFGTLAQECQDKGWILELEIFPGEDGAPYNTYMLRVKNPERGESAWAKSSGASLAPRLSGLAREILRNTPHWRSSEGSE